MLGTLPSSRGPLPTAALMTLLGLTTATALAGPHAPPRPHPIHPRPVHPAAGPPVRKAPTPPDSSAEGLLRQMLQAENNLALGGDQVTVVSRGGLDISSEQHVLRNGARAFRLEYVRPPRLAGEVIVDNGRLNWNYLPSAKKLEVRPSQIQRLRQRVSQVIRQIKRGTLQVQWIGRETVAGHSCEVVQVMPRRPSPAPWRRFWIDPSNGAQLKIEQYDASGRRQSLSSYTTVTYNPPLDRHAFEPPRTPRDVQVLAPEVATPLPSIPQAQVQAGFTVGQPGYLPPGFRFQSASVSDFRGRKMVAVRYANGLNVLSLFETPDPSSGAGNPQAGKIRRPRPGVLVTRQAGLQMILVGNLGQDEMEKVLASVH